MATNPIDPWDLDEYARGVHHIWAYWVTKVNHATEAGDEETVERYTGKLALLSDKVVALCKVKALWKTTCLIIEPEKPEPDSIDERRSQTEAKVPCGKGET
jgi:hypothetical protein